MKKTLILSKKFFIKNSPENIKIIIEGKEEDVNKIIELLKKQYYYIREVSEEK
ncbi:MAG: hypothetical protein QXM27_02855 [Candidatus Pacearchaeota archaeon]